MHGEYEIKRTKKGPIRRSLDTLNVFEELSDLVQGEKFGDYVDKTSAALVGCVNLDSYVTRYSSKQSYHSVNMVLNGL